MRERYEIAHGKKFFKKNLRKTLNWKTDGQELCLGDIKSYSQSQIH